MLSSTSAYILVAYPISHSFREKVSKITGPDAQFVLLAELRNSGLRRMLSFLRSMEKRSAIYIPLEDEHSEPLLPMLLSVASFSSAGGVFVVSSNGSLRKIRRLQAICNILRLVITTVLAFMSVVCTQLLIAWLRRQPQASMTPQDSKSILYINANLWFGVRAGGSVGHIAGVANAFADAGYHVDLASANHQVMLRNSIRQVILKAPRAFGFPPELNSFRYNYTALKQLRCMAAGRQYGFLYQRLSVMNFVGVILSRNCRVPLVVEYNGSEIWVAKNWGRSLLFSKLGLAIEDVCLRHAHRIVVVSSVLADELVARGVNPERIVCYPNCVDPQHYSPKLVSVKAVADVRERYEIPNDAVVVAFVGTFGRWHGASILAAAVKELVDHESSWLDENRVRFAMIGDGLQMNEVRDLIGGPKYSRWVVLTGLIPQAETIAYLAAADVLVSPHVQNSDGSRFFGSPTKLFEYMAMQKGIIASDLDQIGEVLSAGIRVWQQSADRGKRLNSSECSPAFDTGATAVLARPGDVGDLILAIKLLVERSDFRKRLGLNSRRELLGRYTWSHHAARILNSLSLETQQEIADVALAESAL
jgi:glycosyltransferase involved in cell wall biosynthesis